MDALVARAVFAAVALLLVGGTTWSFHRYSAPLLFDLVERNEMVAAAVHRLLAVGHFLLGTGLAVALMPSASPKRGLSGSLFSATAGLLALLALGHLGLVVSYLRVRSNRSARQLIASRPWVIPGATPPTVPMPSPPVFHPAPVPGGFAPPSPPPWSRPIPPPLDPWAPPPR